MGAVPAAASSGIVFGEISCEVVPDRESAGSVGGAVSVKNTFIDDFVENSSDNAAQDSRAVTTMPPALSRALLRMTSDADGKCVSDTPSTAASSNHSAPPSATPTPREEQLPLPMPTQIGTATPVRNTFIHYAQPSDQRIVQSMPHGMFGQCLITELLGDAVVKTQDAVKAPVAARQAVQELRPAISSLTSLIDIDGDSESLAPGTEVVIIGLSKLPAFNGLKGTIQCFDEETDRFSVLLVEPTGGHKWVKVKRDNVDPVVSLPPPRSPNSYFPEVQTTPTWEEYSVHSLSLTALV